MSCAHCGAVEQRGRFCVRCGKRLPRPLTLGVPRPRRPRSLQPMDVVRAVPAGDDLTEPVLRLDRPSRPAVPHAGR